MPPTLQPNENREQATIRWLTEILAALVSQSADGLLVITRAALHDDHRGLDLLESKDTNGNILLRFESVRDMAVYPLGGGARWDGQNQAQAQRRETPSEAPSPPVPQQELFPDLNPSANGNQPNGVVSPKTQQQIRDLERVLAKQKLVSRIFAGKLKQEQQKRTSLEGLLENAGLFNTAR